MPVKQAKGMEHIQNLLIEAVDVWQGLYGTDPELWKESIKTAMANHRLNLIQDLMEEERKKKKELDEIWGRDVWREE
jgi:hypothetical protein